MSRTMKIVVGFLAFDAVAVAAFLGYKAFLAGPSGSPQDSYEWLVMDGVYQPRNYVEEFIRNDALGQGITPIHIRNFGQNASVLRKFKGSKFAHPRPIVVDMTYTGLEDWMLVDIRYQNPDGREIRRTVLYIKVDGAWKVGDSGRLTE